MIPLTIRQSKDFTIHSKNWIVYAKVVHAN